MISDNKLAALILIFGVIVVGILAFNYSMVSPPQHEFCGPDYYNLEYAINGDTNHSIGSGVYRFQPNKSVQVEVRKAEGLQSVELAVQADSSKSFYLNTSTGTLRTMGDSVYQNGRLVHVFNSSVQEIDIIVIHTVSGEVHRCAINSIRYDR